MNVQGYLEAAAAALDLPIAAEHRPGVERYLQVVASLAPLVMSFELHEADESGNVFRPVELGQ